jgi:hypothetical protein
MRVWKGFLTQYGGLRALRVRLVDPIWRTQSSESKIRSGDGMGRDRPVGLGRGILSRETEALRQEDN